MFNMKELNIINKILTMILVSIVIFVTDNDMLIYILSSVGILYCINSKKMVLVLLFAISIVGGLINISFDFIEINKVYDLILIVGFNFLMISTFTIVQKRYIFDKTIYRFKDYKKTKKHFKNCYYDNCLKNNKDQVSKYNSLINNKYLNRQAVLKTKQDLNDIYLLNKLRFYQVYNKKRALFPDKWKKYDTLYLLILLTLFSMLIYTS